eukprot:CAMPEP_0116852208 /NCGR_PEP_ID=MMETSP0418-20121206/17161_1 /TAXON_ID=1158023 /ORGANISM="Astrosyne radiata, Strain 13vi08-1A" /LENGTH=194 /DNA_ID=CAMNT_0004484337 /DNA_START=72 /DNA_END=656 /DNA_ORIENTATION=+
MSAAHQPQQQQRRVHFETTPEGNIGTRVFVIPSQHALGELWWKKEEISGFFKSAVDQLDSDQESPFQFHKTYCNSIAEAYVLSTRGSLKETPFSLRQTLALWFTVEPSKRGLEKFIVLGVGHDRIRQRRRLIERVLLAQKRCQDDGLQQDDATKLVRAASESLSHGAKRFAALLGGMDEVSATVLSCQAEQTSY